MTDPRVHIVSFDVPLPDNYGGVIDVFHKVRHLHSLGAAITLHCFTYGRPQAEALRKYCTNVHYYPRKVSKLLLLQSSPYIVSSRMHDELLKNIRKDDGPVLLEGLHCTGQFQRMGFPERKILVRAHNIEHDYYRHLSATETHLFKRIYLEQESAKLEKYEPTVLSRLPVAAISAADHQYFQSRYGQSTHIPAFHRNDSVTIQDGAGDYFLYHGNLGVSENLAALHWLLKHVWPELRHKLIVAGQKIPSSIIREYAPKGIEFRQSPDAAGMESLIRNAQVILLPAMQATGIKLKLIESLYNGRHLVVNSAMANETPLRTACHVSDDPLHFADTANRLFNEPFETSAIRDREDLLLEHYSNRTAAGKLWNLLQAS